MAEYGSGKASARSNIYTVLVFIAFLMLACGVGYVWYRNVKLFGTSNPFDVTQKPVPATSLLA